MEKKTIGKFISALRRAQGMTQKELADRLFVSDKTVSRWECDESTPELSLIPVIAEIFGITADELLRGERNPIGHREDLGADGEREAKQKEKSDRQFRNMLTSRMKRYRCGSMIAAGLGLAGLLAAMLINIGFLASVIGFCVGSAFLAAGVICQLCFLNFYIMDPGDEEDEARAARICEANEGAQRIAVRGILWQIGLASFLLPLITNVQNGYLGLRAIPWMQAGVLLAAIIVTLTWLFAVRFPVGGKKGRSIPTAQRVLLIGAVLLILVPLIAGLLDGRPQSRPVSYDSFPISDTASLQ